MADTIVAYQGWGSSAQGWGDGTWGTDAATNIPAATTALGDESVALDQVLAATGLAGTSSVGIALGRGGLIATVTGLSATATAMGGTEEHVWSEIDASQTPSWANISTSQTPAWTDILT